MAGAGCHTEVKIRICPAGNRLYGNGGDCVINGYQAIKFQGAQQASNRRRLPI